MATERRILGIAGSVIFGVILLLIAVEAIWGLRIFVGILWELVTG